MISEVDWFITKDAFSIIGTVGALVIGTLALFTWRRQLKETNKDELAKMAVFKASLDHLESLNVIEPDHSVMVTEDGSVEIPTCG